MCQKSVKMGAGCVCVVSSGFIVCTMRIKQQLSKQMFLLPHNDHSCVVEMERNCAIDHAPGTTFAGWNVCRCAAHVHSSGQPRPRAGKWRRAVTRVTEARTADEEDLEKAQRELVTISGRRAHGSWCRSTSTCPGRAGCHRCRAPWQSTAPGRSARQSAAAPARGSTPSPASEKHINGFPVRRHLGGCSTFSTAERGSASPRRCTQSRVRRKARIERPSATEKRFLVPVKVPVSSLHGRAQRRQPLWYTQRGSASPRKRTQQTQYSVCSGCKLGRYKLNPKP